MLPLSPDYQGSRLRLHALRALIAELNQLVVVDSFAVRAQLSISSWQRASDAKKIRVMSGC
jgi:hypothetical protein